MSTPKPTLSELAGQYDDDRGMFREDGSLIQRVVHETPGLLDDWVSLVVIISASLVIGFGLGWLLAKERVRGALIPTYKDTAVGRQLLTNYRADLDAGKLKNFNERIDRAIIVHGSYVGYLGGCIVLASIILLIAVMFYTGFSR